MTNVRKLASIVAVAAVTALPSALAVRPAAAQDASYTMTIGAKSFQPGSLTVKSGVKIKLVVSNASSKTAEFESSDLNREKVIAAGSSAVVYIGPLAPGSYGVFDDFNPSVKGQIVAK